MKSWQWIAIPLTALTISGCSSLFQSNQSKETVVDEQWDCTEVDENGEWDCEEVEEGVSTEDLVAAVGGNDGSTPTLSLVGPTPTTQASLPRSRSSSKPVVTALAPPPSQDTESTESEQIEEEEDLPDYLWLAYEPETETRIQDLPDEFYVVQLAAFATKEKAIEYVSKQKNLRELRGVRVLAKEKAHFNILLGIYENKRRAERAVKSVEGELGGKTPWIRSMSSIKTAMKAADDKFGEKY
ncbi:MAG: SPOR domain-containing protein [Gammaproteobacteria bacterium]|nr:SPOR domain-containing protein [Gammaproteobacteria bacterium]